MSLEVKIHCQDGAEAAIISSLVSSLHGVDYEIRVTQSYPPSKKGQYQSPKPVDGLTRDQADMTNKTTVKPRPPGEIKRKVLAAYAAKPETYHTQRDIEAATGFSAERVRSTIADAFTRNELERKTDGAMRIHRITKHGLDRLKDCNETQNTQAAHVGNAA